MVDQRQVTSPPLGTSGIGQPMAGFRLAKTLFFGALSVALILLMMAYIVFNERATLVDGARANARVIAELVADQTQVRIQAVDQQLKGIASLLQALPDSKPRDPVIRRYLLEQMQVTPYLMDLLVLDGQGDIIHWTGSGEPPGVRDRGYAAFHLARPDSGELYIGPPKLSRVHAGQWFFGASRAISDPDGRLKRILVAIIDIAELYRDTRQHNFAVGNQVTLAGANGLIYTRIAGHRDAVGRKAEASILAALGSGDSGTFEVGGAAGQGRLVVGYRRVLGTPLVAISSYPERRVLEFWRVEVRLVVLIGVFLSLVLGWLTWSQLRDQRELERSRQRLALLSVTDPLTGVYNRRYLMQAGSYEFERARRYQHPLACVVLDIDLFKKVNDGFGHEAGDRVLISVAGCIRESCRQIDVAVRSGGEEFILLLPESDLEQAGEVAERLRRQIAETRVISDKGTVQVSASFGVSQLAERDERIDDLVIRTDDALYLAKQRGRNCVVRSGPAG